jgi:hypothetical protein
MFVKALRRKERELKLTAKQVHAQVPLLRRLRYDALPHPRTTPKRPKSAEMTPNTGRSCALKNWPKSRWTPVVFRR